MTNEKAPTKEDVEEDDARARDALEKQATFHGGDIIRVGALGALDRLRDAALLGAQVPGLEKELTGMTDNFDRAASGLVLATKQVSALQARVVELERERDGWKLTAENRKRWWEEAKSDRDALRAQVAEAQALATAVIRTGGSEEGERLANDIRAALSAPPAETPATERKGVSTDLDPDDECSRCEAPRYAHHPHGSARECEGFCKRLFK